MDDKLLLLTGIGVFSLMLIAIILTVADFNRMSKRTRQNSSADSGKATSTESQRFQDRD